MHIASESALEEWQTAEVEAQDAYMLLRAAVIKYVEGICGAPDPALLTRCMRARLRNLSAMHLVIESACFAGTRPAPLSMLAPLDAPALVRGIQ